MANTNTTTQITSAMTEYYSKVILERAEPELVHDRYGQQRPIPKRSSKTIKWSRYGLFASSASTPSGVLADIETRTAPLSEGVTPEGKYAARADVTATLQQYGDFAEVTDMVDLTNPDPVLTELSEMLGDSAGRSIDIVHRDQLAAGTNTFFSGAATTVGTVEAIVDTDLFQAVLRDLASQVAKRFTEIIRATDGVGTQPIRSSYWGIVHTDVHMPDLDDLPDFTPVHEYASQGPVQPGEVGSLKNIRFVETTQAKIDLGAGATSSAVKNTAGEVDVYYTLIFGKNAYGISPLAGNAMRSITKSLGSAGTADPLDQRATTGWKAITAPAKILNDNWMAVVHSAASL